MLQVLSWICGAAQPASCRRAQRGSFLSVFLQSERARRRALSLILQCPCSALCRCSPWQEQLYKQLLDSGFLTDAERDVLRWGRNATGAMPHQTGAHALPGGLLYLLQSPAEAWQRMGAHALMVAAPARTRRAPSCSTSVAVDA